MVLGDQLLNRNVQRFRGGPVFKALRLLYHSTYRAPEEGEWCSRKVDIRLPVNKEVSPCRAAEEGEWCSAIEASLPSRMAHFGAALL